MGAGYPPHVSWPWAYGETPSAALPSSLAGPRRLSRGCRQPWGARRPRSQGRWPGQGGSGQSRAESPPCRCLSPAVAPRLWGRPPGQKDRQERTSPCHGQGAYGCPARGFTSWGLTLHQALRCLWGYCLLGHVKCHFACLRHSPGYPEHWRDRKSSLPCPPPTPTRSQHQTGVSD